MGHGVKKFIAEENWLQNCKYLLQGCIDCILMICGPLAVIFKIKSKVDIPLIILKRLILNA